MMIYAASKISIIMECIFKTQSSDIDVSNLLSWLYAAGRDIYTENTGLMSYEHVSVTDTAGQRWLIVSVSKKTLLWRC